ncbi:MAG: hypothetical protein QM477_04685 [Planctomycetota bacterium]
MNYRTNIFQNQKPGRLTMLLGALSILAICTMMSAQQPGDDGTNTGDHGDNPVVGSLPIEVDTELDLMFGEDTRVGSVHATAPMLALIGGTDLEESILDASGSPNGRVNSDSRFTILGLRNSGTIVLDRDDFRNEKIILSQWFSGEYFGGRLTMASNVGTFSSSIEGEAKVMPMKFLATSLAPFVDALITAEGAGIMSPTTTIHVVIVGEVVTLTYLP